MHSSFETIPEEKEKAAVVDDTSLIFAFRRTVQITGPQRFEAAQLARAGCLAELETANAAPFLNAALPMNQEPRRDADGRLLPDDVAIASFVNWKVMAEAASPLLTPVDLKLTGLGAEAGRCTAAMIGGTNE